MEFEFFNDEENNRFFDIDETKLFKQRSTGSFKKMIEVETKELPEEFQTLTNYHTLTDFFEEEDSKTLEYVDIGSDPLLLDY